MLPQSMLTELGHRQVGESASYPLPPTSSRVGTDAGRTGADLDTGGALCSVSTGVGGGWGGWGGWRCTGILV